MSMPEAPLTPAEYMGNGGNLHLVLNGTSTSYRKVVRQVVTDLHLNPTYHNRFNEIFTEEKEELTQEKIADAIQEGDVIVGCGGDDGDEVIIETLLRYPGIEPAVRQIPFLSIPGGNANMGPKETIGNDGRSPIDILGLLSYGEVDDQYALQATTEPASQLYTEEGAPIYEESDRLVAYFCGKGIVGACTKELAEVRHNSLRKVRSLLNLVDGPAALRGTRYARKAPFSVTETVTRDGEAPQITEHPHVIYAGLIKGEFMAKYGKFPSRVNEEGFYQVMIEDAEWSSIAANLIRMKFRRLGGTMIDGSTQLELAYKALDETREVRGHFGGDYHLLAPEGKLTVRQFPHPYSGVVSKRTQAE